ncbi:zinc finger protein 629-like [Pungitius pungitius]|uniref:zinc finger protein 629-like n=1 Tax=Pungitius pungitius TaxID=134920 RepID=UPI002E10E56A
MSFASSLAAQIAAIVDSLSKAAVAEISQLVEEGSLVLRLEMCRKDAEIQELRRSLKRMEVDLCSAQEAAATRAAEDLLRGGGEREAQKSCAVYLEPAHCLSLPGPGTEERRDTRPPVKREPADDDDDPAPQEATDDPASTDMCFEAGDPDDPVWPPPACGMFETSAPPHRAEGHAARGDAGGSGDASPTAEQVADDPLSVPIKVEVEFRPMCMVSEARGGGTGLAASRPADRYSPFAPPRAGPSAAEPPAPGSNAGDRVVNGNNNNNNPRAKRPANVWRSNLKVFPRVSQPEEHRASHQLFKPFRCLKCGKSFTQKTRLKTHQSVHTGERPFSCKICGKMFSRQDNCLRHERFHSGLKPHSCGRCGKSFTVLGNLKIHQEIHLQGR